MATVETVTPAELEEAHETPGIERKIVFKTDTNIMIQAHVAGGTTSAWHHHCDRVVYGYLIESSAALEYGPDGRDRHDIGAGGFVHIPPRTVHRDLNPTTEEHVWLLNFVGSGPLVENVDGPDSE